ncbi:hypothetical protein ACN26Y_05710 [Micromonospora sp. WMMD558]|uniref:hypothetical protein n=1 Tax=unclassified Micromonospora TaxID=2617518 RepID=UPI0012B47D4E|nr:hypothetical protein [Micromonospora sp. WMMC415]QGN45823.1 hypothetical protein GKC29_02445 [Micromonospora sp. WMMC415]
MSGAGLPAAALATALAVAVLSSGCTGPEKEAPMPAEHTPAPAGGSDSPPPSASAGSPARTGPALSSTTLPTMGPPTAPPKRPTDPYRANVLAGRITRGGDGPCYGLTTDDGREYALHGAGVGTFATGTWVRVTIGPATPGVDCGAGIPATIVKISPVG